MHRWHTLSTPAAVHLPMTLCGGQCFRWRPTPRGTWFGVVNRSAYELCVASKPPSPGAQHPDREQQTATNSSCLSPMGETLWFRCLSSEVINASDVAREALFLHHYLALDVDMQKLWLQWTVDNPMLEHPLAQFLISHATAEPPICIRHLRQDLHETLFAFLCSQNNNLQRIRGLMERMATSFGDHLCDYNLLTGEVRSAGCNGKVSKKGWKHSKQTDRETNGEEWTALHSLPTIEQLARRTKDDLQALGFGYRSRFIVECASIIEASGVIQACKKDVAVGSGYTTQLYRWYDDLLSPNLTLCERRQKLLALPGVGRKVSDCVLLFAVGHHEIVPIDTHMAQVAMEYLAKWAADKPNVRRGRKNGGGVKRNREGERGRMENTAEGSPSWHAVLSDWYEEAKNSRLKVPTLLPKHHDAIQTGFQHLFGDYSGWAHSILFYIRTKGIISDS